MTDLSRLPLSTHPITLPRPARAAHPANHRATLVRWLRKTHGWFGLWGAVIGLIFGVSGIWLNHRAVMKLPVAQQKIHSQIMLPDPIPASPQAMQTWLRQTLGMPEPASRVRVEQARPAPWSERPHEPNGTSRPLMQPEQWIFSFGGPAMQLQVEYWVGNRSVSIRQTDNGIVGTLISLHLGRGMTVPWILLVDTLAGCLIFLSISGLWLWVLTTKKRVVGWTIFGLGSLLTIGLAIARL